MTLQIIWYRSMSWSDSSDNSKKAWEVVITSWSLEVSSLPQTFDWWSSTWYRWRFVRLLWRRRTTRKLTWRRAPGPPAGRCPWRSRPTPATCRESMSPFATGMLLGFPAAWRALAVECRASSRTTQGQSACQQRWELDEETTCTRDHLGSFNLQNVDVHNGAQLIFL